MKKIFGNIANRTKGLPRKLYCSIYKKVDPLEREFNRAWPLIDSIEGLLVSPDQEKWLFKNSRKLSDETVMVEIGSFKGRSTICLGLGCVGSKKHVYAIDTFNGNESDFLKRNYFDEFINNIKKANLSDYVTPLAGLSSEIAEKWNKPINFLFIDGSHQFDDVISDFNAYFPHVARAGIIALHDVHVGWPGPFKAWNENIKNSLIEIGYCSTIAYGRKP